MTIAKATAYSLLLSLILLHVVPALQEPAKTVALEIVSRRFSSGYIPAIGSYVEYEVTLVNVGTAVIEDQSLRVTVASDSSKTWSTASYSVRELRPGESKTLHLGPFKIEDVGRHRLLAEMGEVSLQYEQDSFITYGREAIQTITIAILLIVAGAGVVGFSLYKKIRVL